MSRRRPPQRPQKKRRRRRPPAPLAVRRLNRALIMAVFFTLCIFGLIGRMWFLQETYGDDYNQFVAMQRAARDRDNVNEVFAPMRGGFVDRHMQPITGTQQVFTVTLNAQALHLRHQAAQRNNSDVDVRDEIINAITVALNMPRFEITEILLADHEGNLVQQSGRYRRVLRHDVPAEIAIPLTEMFAEVNREETSLRWYQDPFFAPQVVGFIRGDYIWGLEAQYRTQLEGEQGRNVFAQGETETIPVRDGFTMVTTLDGDIQRLAQYHVNRAFAMHESRFAGMIVMEPFTGEVLAMAQAPTFALDDPLNSDFFTCPHLQEIWPYLDSGQQLNQVMTLWRNYHTTRSSEPGSTFKPFVIAAGIEEGVINRNTPFFCEGRREIIDQEVWCHSRDWGCGSLSLRRALYRSCNLAMADINRALGRDLFYRYRGYFGFGERTGIDLPGEECVSSPYVMYPWHRLNPVEMATSSMGQGFNATTMQMITGYAALINGGNLMRPFLVSQIVDNQGTVVQETLPTVTRRVISPETSDFIREEMRYVVTMRPGVGELTSTGHQLYIPGHSIGGKTGTAQQGVRAEGISNLTYIAFLPVENPQFLVLMTIDNIVDTERRMFAGNTVAPLMRDFFLELIRIRNIQPADDSVGVMTPELFGTPMPDLGGQRLTDAVRNVINMGTGGFQVVGGGTVVSHHWPPSGSPMPENATIIFYMDNDTRITERMVSVPDVTGLSVDTANFILLESGLPPVLFTDRRADNNDDDFNPRTARPEAAQADDEAAATAQPLPYFVHQQFPAPGSEIEQGTQVIIRAR